MEKKTEQTDTGSKKYLLLFTGGMLFFDIVFLALAAWRFELWWNELTAAAAMFILLGGMYIFQIRKVLTRRWPWFLGLHVLELVVIIVSYEAEGTLRPVAAVPVLTGMLAGSGAGITALIYYSVISALICADPTEILFLYLAAGLIGVCLLADKKKVRDCLAGGAGFFLAYAVGSLIVALYAYAQLQVSDIWNGILGGALQLLPVLCFLPFLVEGGFHLPGAASLAAVVLVDFPALAELQERDSVLFKHSRLVARLSSQAAAGIGCNALLAEAGGLYHEIGKGISEDCDKESLAICKKYRIPASVQTIIKEHNPDKKTPSSKESAIVMISDTILHVMEQNRKRDSGTDTEETIRRAFKIREDSGAFLLSGLSEDETAMLKEFYIRVLGRA